MVTPIDTVWWGKALKWTTAIFKYGKRIATLEARVSALEEARGKQLPDACPYCGERGMRMVRQGRFMGGREKWREDDWTCQKCGKTERRGLRF
jgi:hypothetical protein